MDDPNAALSGQIAALTVAVRMVLERQARVGAMQFDAMTRMREECLAEFGTIAADSPTSDSGKILIAQLFRGLGGAAS